ncbi:MAG: Tn3 family transposase [Actinomycetota bacterium]|nr:Tn3 family transposase [Actinomycetota bacterium]
MEDGDLSLVPANRQRMLARYVRHATSQALARRDPRFRHPALLAFCAESAVRLTDEIVDLLAQGVGAQHAKARSALVALKLNVAEGANSSVLLLAELLEVLLDDTIPDAGVRDAVWKRSTPEQLQQALELAAEIRRPEGDSHLDQLNDRYHATREFAPRALAALRLRAAPGGERLLAAVEVLRDLNARGVRKVPETAPVDFVPRAWRPYVLPAGGGIDRRYWELCLLSELRGGLRAGEIWVAGSRRYQDPERSLISRDDWPSARDRVRGELELPASAGPRLEGLRGRAAGHRQRLDADLACGDADVTIDEHGNLKVARLRAQPRNPSIDKLANDIANELEIVDLPDVLFDLDAATRFTELLTHAGGSLPRSKDHQRNLIAAIIALACNLGVGRMARSSAISPAALGWTAEWYLGHDTLEAATGRIVDHQSQIALARLMGTGQHSSSDGKRRLVNPDSQQARAMPRYFGRHQGLTHYTFVSDQHSHFATRVIRTTVRDATYVLDGILDKHTQLPITTHSTDTAGYSDIIFALFDLLGLQFAPRLAGLADTRLWHDSNTVDTLAGKLVRNRVNERLIAEQWDEILRLVGSLKDATITASLLVGRLHAQQRRSKLAAALQDYGRLVKTEFVLRYLTHPDQRRSIHRQLNKRENINWLEDQIFYGNNGKIRLHSLDRQSTQAAALALVSTAITTWNTDKMNAIIDRRRAAGETFDDEQLGRLSPAICEHILINGRYLIDPDRAAHRPPAPLMSLAMPTYH